MVFWLTILLLVALLCYGLGKEPTKLEIVRDVGTKGPAAARLSGVKSGGELDATYTYPPYSRKPEHREILQKKTRQKCEVARVGGRRIFQLHRAAIPVLSSSGAMQPEKRRMNS